MSSFLRELRARIEPDLDRAAAAGTACLASSRLTNNFPKSYCKAQMWSGRSGGTVHNPRYRRNHRMPSSSELAAEFDVLMRRAGITIPQDRRAAALASYADLHEQIALLHNRYAHTDEPANIFRLTPPERL
jgi:hypothetical protein